MPTSAPALGSSRPGSIWRASVTCPGAERIHDKLVSFRDGPVVLGSLAPRHPEATMIGKTFGALALSLTFVLAAPAPAAPAHKAPAKASTVKATVVPPIA